MTPTQDKIYTTMRSPLVGFLEAWADHHNTNHFSSDQLAILTSGITVGLFATGLTIEEVQPIIDKLKEDLGCSMEDDEEEVAAVAVVTP